MNTSMYGYTVIVFVIELVVYLYYLFVEYKFIKKIT